MPAIIYKNKEGVRVPSVTTIISQWGLNKNALLGWAWKQGEAGIPLYEKKDADIGTLTHLLIEADIKGKEINLAEFPMDIIKPAQQAFKNFLKWKDRIKFKPVETEISLVSEKHQYGGTLDCVAMIEDFLSIIDWKSGKEIYEDNIIQLASYEQLWNENFPDNPIKGFEILRTGKEIASFSDNWYGEFPRAFDVFLHLRSLYNLAKEIKKLK